MSRRVHILVPDSDDGQRLERWLQSKFPHVAYAMLQKSLRQGDVRVDGVKAKGDARLSAGQEVRLPPAFTEQAEEEGERKLTKHETQFARSLVIYEDDAIIAFNKPSGLATQGGSKTNLHMDRLLLAFTTNPDDKPKLVHRLDKETSGVLVVAKNRAAAQALGHAFKSREVRKTYLALTLGSPRAHDGVIKHPLAKVKDRVVVDRENGKSALTNYRALAFSGKDVALMGLRPETGRMHQLRVHLERIKTPILGDEKYGGVPAEPLVMGYEAAQERLWLHALYLHIPHPFTGRMLDLYAPVPAEMRRWVEAWHMEVPTVTDTDHPVDPMDEAA